jgi:hypothetical protein
MDQLIASYRQGKVILFVGAGVSMNLGLPSWNDLVAEIAKQLGYDPDIYKTFGDNLSLAEYYKIQKRSIGPLRSWMDVMWHSSSVDISKSEIHKMIVEMNFPIIYTTNYDRWIEKAFEYYGKKYCKITNVGDLSDLDRDATQIIKFHGDFDDDNSIVLTETSYYDRLNFEHPIDIKLRSDTLARSVLFIGYSLSDINIRLLFYKLAKMWQNHAQPRKAPSSYIFMHKPNPVQEEILEQWGIKMISSNIDNPNDSLLDFLSNLELNTTGP